MPRILIVDDNTDMLDTLEHLFRFYEYTVLKAENGKEALEVCDREQPDVIIMDALMPVMDGFEALKHLKANSRLKDIPVIFLTANYTEDEHRVMGLELGADDYILKPFNAKELVSRVKSLLNKKQLIENLRQVNLKLAREQWQTSQEVEKLRQLTMEMEKNQMVDPLTGLYNEEFFRKRLAEEFLRAKRYNLDLSLVLIDVDFLKKINESYGEQTGDYVLMKLANVILNNTRQTDIVFRRQRNQFAILLPNTNETGAFYEAERVRSAVQQTAFLEEYFDQAETVSSRRRQKFEQLTVSAGIATFQEDMENDQALIQRAKEALTKAKALGRNMTVRYSKLKEAEDV